MLIQSRVEWGLERSKYEKATLVEYTYESKVE